MPLRNIAVALLTVVVGGGGIADADIPPEPPITELDRRHWAFESLGRPAVPHVQDGAWGRTPVDRFILARLETKGLRPLPEADRHTLLRRVTFDLTGLPPTPDEMSAFLADEAPDAYERVVDRLLSDRAYGERWAQHWLDLARFAETDGYEFDHVRPEAWRYRDWVIDALNADVPFDRFVSLQLAGDEIRPDDAAAHVATGFLLCGPDMPDINLQEERRHMFLNGMTANVGEVLLGLQLGCAQCHDHKTDPVSQYDFYRLRAYFESIELFQDQLLPLTSPDSTQPVKARIARTAANGNAQARLWIRGDFRRAGPLVPPDVPRVVNVSFDIHSDEEPDTTTESRRTSLADWVTRADNPLTARVIVNRLWQHHFGVGLAATPSDFGIMGDAPTHPELLDWLATELVDCHWSLKSLHRMIVTSSVYRTASRPEPSSEESQPERHAVWSPLIEADPSNQWLGRMRRRRLEGEAIRDAMLSVSGMLNREEHGPGVRPLLAAEVTSTLLKNQWPVTPGVDQHSRRSIYLFARRNLRYPLFEVFDKPDPNLSCSRRSETTIAPQALHLLNSDFAIECAERLADRIRTTHHDSADQIETCYRLVYGRSPEDHERADAAVFLREGTDAASLTDFCLALFNTNEFVYID